MKSLDASSLRSISVLLTYWSFEALHTWPGTAHLLKPWDLLFHTIFTQPLLCNTAFNGTQLHKNVMLSKLSCVKLVVCVASHGCWILHFPWESWPSLGSLMCLSLSWSIDCLAHRLGPWPHSLVFPCEMETLLCLLRRMRGLEMGMGSCFGKWEWSLMGQTMGCITWNKCMGRGVCEAFLTLPISRVPVEMRDCMQLRMCEAYAVE